MELFTPFRWTLQHEHANALSRIVNNSPHCANNEITTEG